MLPSNQPTSQTTEHQHKPLAPVALPSTTLQDLAVIVLTTVFGFLGGIVISLIFLGGIQSEMVVLLAAVGLVGATATVLLVRRRTQLEAQAVNQWARAAELEFARLTSRLNESEHARLQELQDHHAQLQVPPFLTNPPTQDIPLIYGWQALGLGETEIVPQLAILAELFKGQDQVHIVKKFSGGHRNRGVYLVRSSNEAERIVKIARSADIRAERLAQELINRFSQNNGGQHVRDTQKADDDTLGGIVYRLASLRRNAEILNFDAYYRETQNASACASVVEQCFAEILPHSIFREKAVAPLFQTYSLSEGTLNKGWNVASGLAALQHVARQDEWMKIQVAGRNIELRNPFYWAEHVMPTHHTREFDIVRGVVHGDLHSGNLLIQQPGPNLWYIDFAKARAGAPTLLDFARLETDIKFYLVDGTDQPDYLEQALRFETTLLAPALKQALDSPLPDLDLYNPAFQKAGACIAALRHLAGTHARHAREEIEGHFVGDTVLPYYLALYHFTLRTLKYQQCNPAQKTYAFLAAGMLCERIHQLLT